MPERGPGGSSVAAVAAAKGEADGWRRGSNADVMPPPMLPTATPPRPVRTSRRVMPSSYPPDMIRAGRQDSFDLLDALPLGTGNAELDHAHPIHRRVPFRTAAQLPHGRQGIPATVPIETVDADRQAAGLLGGHALPLFCFGR